MTILAITMFQPSFKLFFFISIIITIINLKSVTAGFKGFRGCFGDIGFYPAWTHWSECSVTCGEGKRMRECRCFDDNDKATSESGEGGCTIDTVDLQVVDKEKCHLKDCPGDDDDDVDLIIIIIIAIFILPLLKLFG